MLRTTLPAVDRLGMPLVTSGQFAYVYKLKSMNGGGNFAVRCFRGYLGDRDQRYRAIQEHLMDSPVAFLSDFSYAPEGILVGGNRFPILFMKWIDGPTLDVYIGEMLNRPDVLLHLSEEWLRLLNMLRTAGVAHGDLQHGNIIVEHGQLRLVDHDGIFVTKMAGWAASEVGHQHYQHPRREAKHFDANLDNFSAIVIYLSLLSLAERPSLWKEHHDENLLFTKTDFADTASSTLLKKIRELGPEHEKLADVLTEAANGPATEVPCLLDLVTTKTGLPSWMTAPVDLDATTKTREVIPVEPAYPQRNVRWIPWQDRQQRGPSMPQTPSSATVQTIFGGSPTIAVRDPSDVGGNTLIYSKEFMRKYFLLWYWAAYVVLKFIGFDFFVSIVIALVCLTLACLTFGLARAIDESLKAHTPKPLPGMQPASTQSRLSQPPAALPSNSWSPHVSLPLSPSTGSTDAFVGNLVLGIYHVNDCDWVRRISDKNRVGFSTSSEAISHGFKPCRICWPSA